MQNTIKYGIIIIALFYLAIATPVNSWAVPVDPEPGLAEDPGNNAEEASDGTVNTGASGSLAENINLGNNSQCAWAGLRFPEVGIRPGATITSATIEFLYTGTSDGGNDINIRISGELDPNPAKFTEVSHNISSRSRTTSSGDWTLGAGDTWVGEDYYPQTIDLTDVVQEIVGQAEWKEFSPIVILFQDLSGNDTGRMVDMVQDDVTGMGAVMKIEYTPAADLELTVKVSQSSDDAQELISSGAVNLTRTWQRVGYAEWITELPIDSVGCRFQDVSIPAGREILEAQITFTSKWLIQLSNANTYIYGQTSTKALRYSEQYPAEFSSTPYDITSRPRTSSYVSWPTSPYTWLNDQKRSTWDLSVIVQEIIDRPDWVSDSTDMSMVFIIEGNTATLTLAQKHVYTYDNNPADAASLTIKYTPDCGSLTTSYYRDLDGDGYGDPDSSKNACEQPVGFVDNNGDCNDSDATINPDSIWGDDSDGDGYGDIFDILVQCEQPAGYVLDNTDCNDFDLDEHPNQSWYLDSDGDGYGDLAVINNTDCKQPAGYVVDNTDCDDTDAYKHPGQSWYPDVDGDGYGVDGSFIIDCQKPTGYGMGIGDCDDTNPDEHPGQIWYRDFDEDGYGNSGHFTVACASPAGYVADKADFNDRQFDEENTYTNPNPESDGGSGSGCFIGTIINK